jgi:hypothetical protein
MVTIIVITKIQLVIFVISNFTNYICDYICDFVFNTLTSLAVELQFI